MARWEEEVEEELEGEEEEEEEERRAAVAQRRRERLNERALIRAQNRADRVRGQVERAMNAVRGGGGRGGRGGGGRGGGGGSGGGGGGGGGGGEGETSGGESSLVDDTDTETEGHEYRVSESFFERMHFRILQV